MAMKSSNPRLVIDCWNTLADPSKLVVIVAGSKAFATCWTCSVAVPSEIPGLSPNDTETDGSWPEWLIDWGPTVSLNETTDWRGTRAPEDVLKAIFSRESAWSWYFGSSSSSTRY